MWLKNAANDHRMGGKHDDKWVGPYIIHEKLEKGRYRLRSATTGKIQKQVYNSCLLKDYCDSDTVSQ